MGHDVRFAGLVSPRRVASVSQRRVVSMGQRTMGGVECDIRQPSGQEWCQNLCWSTEAKRVPRAPVEFRRDRVESALVNGS